MNCPWRPSWRKTVHVSTWHQHPRLSTVDKGLQRGAVGPTRQMLACMCPEKREEKSQSSSINLQAHVALTCFWSTCIVNQQDNLASTEGKSLFINCVSQNKALSSLPGIHSALSNRKTDKNSEWGALTLPGPSLCRSKDVNCKPKSY